MWGIALSGPLPIVALVSRYLTNKLMGRMLILYRRSFPRWIRRSYEHMEH